MDEFDQRLLKSQLKQLADSQPTDAILNTLAAIYSERANNAGDTEIQLLYLTVATGLTHLHERVNQQLSQIRTH